MAVSTIIATPAFQVNPNLLDNWYFVGGGSQQGGGQFPINHNGSTSYSTANAYTIDRWLLHQGSITVNSEGMLGGTLKQLLKSNSVVSGQVYTLSFLGSSGTFASVSGVLSTTGSSWQLSKSAGVFWAGVQYSSGNWDVRISFSDSSEKLAAIKLELGGLQTLCHKSGGVWVLNEVPNYQESIVKCQSAVLRKTAQYSPNSGGYMNMPDGVTADNLISVFVTVTGSATGNDSFVAIPSFVNTTGISSNTNRCYIYKASDMSLVTSLPFNTVTVTFVYQG